MESLYAQIRALNAFHAFFFSYTSSTAMLCRLALLWYKRERIKKREREGGRSGRESLIFIKAIYLKGERRFRYAWDPFAR